MSWRAYDPLAEALRARLKSQTPIRTISARRRSHWVLWIESRLIARRLAWIDSLYWLLTLALFASGIGFLCCSWPLSIQRPWPGTPTSDDYSSIIATAAVSFAFSATILGAVASPLS